MSAALNCTARVGGLQADWAAAGEPGNAARPPLRDGQVPAASPSGETGIELGNDFAEIERHDLDEDSWIEVVPRLIRDPGRLFAQLLRDLDWSQRQRWAYNRKIDEPRLTADYSRVEAAPGGALSALARRLSDVYGIPYDGVWVNLYRDEHDSVSCTATGTPAGAVRAPSRSSRSATLAGSSSSPVPGERAPGSPRKTATSS
jgi:hypothetical protein